MHPSFVSTPPLGPGISGAFNFSIYESPAKSPALRGKNYGKIPAKSPALPGTDNNEEQQMTWIIWINFPRLSYFDSTYTFASMVL